MSIINELITFFGLDLVPTNFIEFLPWFMKLLLGVFIVCFIFKCLFTATWKIGKELK